MQSKLGRRDFTKGVSLMSLFAASGWDLGCSDSGRDENATPFRHAAAPLAAALGVANPTSLGNRISLNVYSFNIALDTYIQNRGGNGLQASLGPTGNPNVVDLLQFCQQQGIYALDATGYYWWNATTQRGYPLVPADADIKAFVDEAKASGIVISGTGVQNNFATQFADQRQSDLQHVRAWCEVAAKLGAPVLRVFAGPIPTGYGWDQVASWMVDCLGQCAEYGKEHGVKIGVQNHGDMLKTADQCIRILRMVDSEWLGAVNDTGYFLTPNPYDDIARLMPYTITLQVKESVRAVKNFQAAATAVKVFVDAVKNSGYTGWLPVETLQCVSCDYDPRIAVPAFVGALRCASGGGCPDAGAWTPEAGAPADAGGSPEAGASDTGSDARGD
jgi:sugar phosphate isomerase/epimerase